MRALQDALDLRSFMRRRQVLKLFRDLLRASPDPQTRAQIRAAFESHRGAVDPLSVRALLMDGRRTLEVLIAAKVPKNNRQETQPPSSDEQDGRVGQGWPWAR